MCAGAWGWGMMFMWVFWLVVLVALVWLILSRGGRFGDRGAGSRGDERAVEILRERYARGEIDAETYRRMLDELGRSTGREP